MTDEITPELFNYLVELAALELAPEEGEYLRGQLNNQLKAIRELERIELPENVPPAAHGVSFGPAQRPALREDVAVPAERADKILAQAPEVDERFIVVPEIPTTQIS